MPVSEPPCFIYSAALCSFDTKMDIYEECGICRQKKESGAPVGCRRRHRAPTLPLRGNIVKLRDDGKHIQTVLGRERETASADPGTSFHRISTLC